MPEAVCYILKGKEPVRCDDINVWQAFMDDASACTVAFDKIGRFEILTTFIGVNIGTPESPKFFKMTMIGMNVGDPPICSGSWKRAIDRHQATVRSATYFLERETTARENSSNGFRFVGYEVLPSELRFSLESEEAAIKAHSSNSPYWFREGRVLIFRPKKNSAADSD